MLNASGFGWNILISLSCCGLTFDKYKCFDRNMLLYSQIVKKRNASLEVLQEIDLNYYIIE